MVVGGGPRCPFRPDYLNQSSAYNPCQPMGHSNAGSPLATRYRSSSSVALGYTGGRLGAGAPASEALPCLILVALSHARPSAG